MQRNACARSCAIIGFFAFQGALAHAIPAPPRQLMKEKSPAIRVLLGAHARFSVSGRDFVFNDSISLAGDSAFNVRCGKENGSGAAYVEFGAGRRALNRLDIRAAELLRMNDRPYRSQLTIISKGTHCLVVNTVDLEKYLAGVISKEMSPSWPLEALKAQAVAARSYAIHQMRANHARDYDLESTTQDQVYGGAAAETPRTLQAVEATRGLALTHGNESLKAYFHANCGGKTEVPAFVWGGETKAFRTVVCPHHARERDRQRWSVRLTAGQIESALKKISGALPRGFRSIASLEAGAPNGSLRLSDVAITDTQGHSLLVSANTFRNAIGNTKLKSTAFQVRRGPSGFTIEGEGHGHGVGMCQVGARAMAEQGRSYRQILQFYYPLAKILPVL